MLKLEGRSSGKPLFSGLVTHLSCEKIEEKKSERFWEV